MTLIESLLEVVREDTNTLQKLIDVVSKYMDWAPGDKDVSGNCEQLSRDLIHPLRSAGFQADTYSGNYTSSNPDLIDFYRANHSQPHWWVEVDNKWIVDPALEQFENILSARNLIRPITDPRYKKEKF